MFFFTVYFRFDLKFMFEIHDVLNSWYKIVHVSYSNKSQFYNTHKQFLLIEWNAEIFDKWGVSYNG